MIENILSVMTLGIQELKVIKKQNITCHNFNADIVWFPFPSGKSKEAEIKRINKELANIRSKFKGDKALDGYSKKKYVCKLLFIFLLGHDIDFGHMEAVNLLSSNKYTEKQIVSVQMFLLCAIEFVKVHSKQDFSSVLSCQRPVKEVLTFIFEVTFVKVTFTLHIWWCINCTPDRVNIPSVVPNVFWHYATDLQFVNYLTIPQNRKQKYWNASALEVTVYIQSPFSRWMFLSTRPPRK